MYNTDYQHIIKKCPKTRKFGVKDKSAWKIAAIGTQN
jgi:hypothetical protein